MDRLTDKTCNYNNFSTMYKLQVLSILYFNYLEIWFCVGDIFLKTHEFPESECGRSIPECYTSRGIIQDSRFSFWSTMFRTSIKQNKPIKLLIGGRLLGAYVVSDCAVGNAPKAFLMLADLALASVRRGNRATMAAAAGIMPPRWRWWLPLKWQEFWNSALRLAVRTTGM